MLSASFPPQIAFAVKLIDGLVGLAATTVAFRAAHLWLKASKVPIEDTTPAIEVSHEDNPALGILEAIVAVNATKAAYDASAALNARAARWSASAAILTAVAVFLGVF